MEGEPFRYMALGAGVQSSALYVLSCQGAYDNPPEVAIFADTQGEPPWVYEQLDRLEEWGSIPVYRVTVGKLHRALGPGETRGAIAAIPAFVRDADGKSGPTIRQCTRDYKVRPIERKARELMGYAPRDRIKRSALCYLGISNDEMNRMRQNRTRWIRNRWPLIELGLGREACARIVRDAGLGEPQKSACVYCPYHSDSYWQWLKDNHSDQFERACAVDDLVRDLSQAGVRQPAFLHRSLRPLGEVQFVDPRQGLLDFGGCENGHCGV